MYFTVVISNQKMVQAKYFCGIWSFGRSKPFFRQDWKTKQQLMSWVTNRGGATNVNRPYFDEALQSSFFNPVVFLLSDLHPV